jgi:hypothetical protein
LALAASLSTHPARFAFKTAVTSGSGSGAGEDGSKEATIVGWHIPWSWNWIHKDNKHMTTFFRKQSRQQGLSGRRRLQQTELSERAKQARMLPVSQLPWHHHYFINIAHAIEMNYSPKPIICVNFGTLQCIVSDRFHGETWGNIDKYGETYWENIGKYRETQKNMETQREVARYTQKNMEKQSETWENTENMRKQRNMGEAEQPVPSALPRPTTPQLKATQSLLILSRPWSQLHLSGV